MNIFSASKISAMVLMLCLLVSVTQAKPPHHGYIDAFGHGSIAVMQSRSGDDYPPLGEFDASRFDYDGKAFILETGKPFSFRAFFKDGKTARELHASLHDSAFDVYHVTYWANTGSTLSEPKWPSRLSEVPAWEMLFGTFTRLDDVFLGWQSTGFSWNDDIPERVRNWAMKEARPGDKLYIALRFQKRSPHIEGRYWNKNTNQWVTPTLISYSDPIAAATVVFR